MNKDTKGLSKAVPELHKEPTSACLNGVYATGLVQYQKPY